MNFIKWIVVVGLFATCTGCAPVYLPPAAHALMIAAKGEVDAGLYVGSHGIDAQLGYAFTPTLALMGAGSFSAGYSDGNTHAYGEIGIGVYSAPRFARFNAFAGFGYGSSTGASTWSFNGTSYSETAKASFSRPFVQGTAAFYTSIFTLGLTTRLAYLALDYLETNGQPAPGAVTASLIEPVLSLGLGANPFKLNVQAGASLPATGDIQFDYNPFILSLGFTFRIIPKSEETR